MKQPRTAPSRQLRARSAARAAASSDVIERQRLIDRQSFVSALLETIDVGIVSCDANGVFMVSNRAEREMFGLGPDGLTGLLPPDLASLIDVIDPVGRHLEPGEYPLMRALRGESVRDVDMLVGPAGGPHRDIVVQGRQILAPDGKVLGAVAALTDVTAERKAARALADAHDRLVEAQRLGQLGSFEYEFATDSWTYSDQLRALWGVEAEPFTPKMTLPLVVPDDLAHFEESWEIACRDGGTHSYECRIKRANDGAERLLRANIEIELSDAGSPLRARGTYMDITDIDVATRAAQRATAFFDAVLTASPDHTFVSDRATGAIIYGSRSSQVLGLSVAELESLGKDRVATLVHPDDQAKVRAVEGIASDLDDGQVVQVQYRARHVDGGWRWLNRRVTPFRRDAGGRVVELLSVVRDVTDVVEAENRLTHAAMHDPLTGLPNRAQLMERLEAALIRGRRDGREVAVLFCDLDGFKQVNDNGGHAAGDAVLLETARRLEAVLRVGDTVARVGGDEFVIIVEPWDRRARDGAPSAPPARDDRVLALRVAQRVAAAMRDPIHVDGRLYVVTASVGIAYGDSVGAGLDGRAAMTADQVLHAADLAMYRAKDRGKNRYEVARAEPEPEPAIPQQRAADAPVQ
jgi:diguanylate cyclase (GGDEF)-like protein/PAS domain S-box-containing protein